MNKLANKMVAKATLLVSILGFGFCYFLYTRNAPIIFIILIAGAFFVAMVTHWKANQRFVKHNLEERLRANIIRRRESRENPADDSPK